MMLVLYAILAVYAIYSYYKYNYVKFLLAYLGLMTKFFMLDQFGSPIEGSDICFVINLILLPEARKRTTNWEQTPYCKWILWIIFFYIIEFAITIVTGAESIQWALLVLRMPLIVLGYFVMRAIPWSIWEGFLRYGLYLTIIQGLLYYLQFLGIHLIEGYNSDYFTGGAINIPRLTPFYIFYCLKKEDVSYRYFLLVFLIGMILLTFVRGMIFGLGISIAYFLYKNKNTKQTILIVLLALMISPFVVQVVETKSGSRSTSADIEEVLSGDLRNIDPQAGTFSFRIAMLVERFQYLVDNPQYLPLGVGMIHEMSPSCWGRFRFHIGTRNEIAFTGWCQIESGDNTWVPILLRYGIIGVILHLLIFIIVLRELKDEDSMMMIFSAVFIYVFATSMDGALFERSSFFYLIVMYLAIIAVHKNEKINIMA